MDIQDLHDQIESQAGTIESQAEVIKQLKEEVAKKSEPSKEQPPASVPGYTMEQIKALEARAAERDALSKQVAELTGKEQQRELESLYPAIKDWSVVKGGTYEERKAHAEAIHKMIDGKPAEKKEEVNPGQQFGKVPPAGAPDVDKVVAEQKAAQQAEMKEAQKRGDLQGVLNNIFKRDPKATKALFSS